MGERARRRNDDVVTIMNLNIAGDYLVMASQHNNTTGPFIPDSSESILTICITPDGIMSSVLQAVWPFCTTEKTILFILHSRLRVSSKPDGDNPKIVPENWINRMIQ